MSAASIWQELTPCPKKYCSQPVKLNCTQFIVAADCEDQPDESLLKKGLYIYDVAEDKWLLFMEYPNEYEIEYPSIAIDNKRHLLYINGLINYALVVDLSTKQHYKLADNMCDLGWSPKSMMIDGEYNVICGAHNPYHLQWDESQQKWLTVHHFTEFERGNGSPGCCFLKSKNEVILFGGMDDANIDTLWRYRIEERKWHKMHDLILPNPTNVFGYALSSDERYIFVLGGEEEGDVFDTADISDIYVIDLLQWKVMKSTATCPNAAKYHAFILPKVEPNELLTAGFLRQCLLSRDSSVFIPSDIVRMLSYWYCEDYLYLLKDRGHWRINIDHILQNLHDCSLSL